jgi:hypothetical protein
LSVGREVTIIECRHLFIETIHQDHIQNQCVEATLKGDAHEMDVYNGLESIVNFEEAGLVVWLVVRKVDEVDNDMQWNVAKQNLKIDRWCCWQQCSYQQH